MCRKFAWLIPANQWYLHNFFVSRLCNGYLPIFAKKGKMGKVGSIVIFREKTAKPSLSKPKCPPGPSNGSSQTKTGITKKCETNFKKSSPMHTPENMPSASSTKPVSSRCETEKFSIFPSWNFFGFSVRFSVRKYDSIAGTL